jgi:hypothetical protein
MRGGSILELFALLAKCYGKGFCGGVKKNFTPRNGQEGGSFGNGEGVGFGFHPTGGIYI